METVIVELQTLRSEDVTLPHYRKHNTLYTYYLVYSKDRCIVVEDCRIDTLPIKCAFFNTTQCDEIEFLSAYNAARANIADIVIKSIKQNHK